MKCKKFIPIEKELKEGTIVEGRVKSIQPYGTFVEL